MSEPASSHAYMSANTTDSMPDAPDTSMLMPDPMTYLADMTPDSLAAMPDSMATVAERTDTSRTLLLRINREKTDLDGAVTFSSKDSLVLIGQNNAFLYGNGQVSYQEFQLNSDEIRMELDSSTVYATGVLDSTGNLVGTPIFKDKGDEYESKSMKYNFKTERGFITEVVTEQGEGYLIGGAAKKMEDGSFFVKDGKYTTCEDHEHPHFYFQITKGKMRPNKDVVTGPGYMVLADVPLPLALH